MRKIIQLIIIVIMFIIGSIFLVKNLQHIVLNDNNEDNVIPQLKYKQPDKQLETFMNGELYTWINKRSTELIDSFGDPLRKDLSAYDYTWWVYQLEENEYIQFGIEDDTIVTIFSMTNYLSIDPLMIGKKYDELNKQLSFKDEVTYYEGLSFYTFILNDEDLISQPLVKLSDDLFLQLYFDTITDELSSIRLLTGDILLRQRFYEMKYRGTIPEILTELDEEWDEVEKGIEQQIFDLTNILRVQHGAKKLIWDDAVSKVAYKHSKDMSDNNYFSHYRQDGSGLKERLQEKDIYYLSAGENIAAQHADAPAAVHGWLNSESHREALLNDEFNYLGVGVYRLYYTQNFLYKP